MNFVFSEFIIGFLVAGSPRGVGTDFQTETRKSLVLFIVHC